MSTIDKGCSGRHIPLILGCTVGLAGAVFFSRKLQEAKKRNHLTALRKRKQKERAAQFDVLETSYPFGPQKAAIVALSFEELTSKLQRRELKARDVLEAYIAKAIVTSREFNCVTEFVPNCFELADELDSLPTVKGPLHGVPICVKDDHDIIGMDSTLGLSSNLYQPKTQTAVMVKILVDAGAIPFCKTNVPQTLLSGGSDNPIFGTTLNHLNKAFGPGGSSSGTGCLVGAGGAHFGLGSDVGGSVRIPAHFSGISTLRATIGRLSGRGVTQAWEECAGVVGVSGILASRARTLPSVYSVLLGTTESAQNQHDPLVVPIPWRSEIFESKQPLRIGYFTSFDFFPTIGDTPSTILRAKAVLELKGHTLIPFELPDPWHIYKVCMALYIADGGNQVYNKLKYDQVSYIIRQFMLGRTFLSYLWLILTSPFRKQTKLFINVPGIERSETVWKYLHEQRKLKHAVLDNMKKSNVDLILMPAYPFPALELKDFACLMEGGVYLCLWNQLDFPAGVVPFGQESGTRIDEYDHKGDVLLKHVKEASKKCKGMPIGVQLVGKPYQEEMVLRILTELEDYKMKHDS